MSKKKSILTIVLSITFICIFAWFFFAIQNKVFVFERDGYEIWHPLYNEFYNLLDNFFSTGELPFYSWNYFLGNNFYSSKSFYLVGDVFAYFGYFLRKMNYFDLSMILTFLKFLTAGMTSYFFFDKFKLKENTKIIGSILYSVSSYSLFFATQSQFLSFYSLLPLIFIGVENYLQKRKVSFFIFSVFFLAVNNYYMFFSVSLFLPIYFIYRYTTLNSCKIWKSLGASIPLIIYYIIGVMLSGILFIPSLYFISQNSRVGSYTNSSLFLFPMDMIVFILSSFFVPNGLMILGENSFFNIPTYNLSELFIWSSAICPLILLYIGFDKSTKNRKNFIVFYCVCLLILFVPFLNSLMHGLGDVSFRWVCILILMNILHVCLFIDSIKQINKQLMKKVFYVVIFLLLLIMLIQSIIAGFSSNVLLSVLAFSISILFISIYFWMIINGKNKFMFLTIIVEICITSFLFYNVGATRQAKNLSKDLINNITSVLQDENSNFVDYVKNLAPSNKYEFYRIYVPFESIYWNYSKNTGVFYGINGLMTYDSTFANSFNKMIELDPTVENMREINITDPSLIQLYSTKYAVVVSDNDLPAGIAWELVTDNYRGGLKIYKNNDYLSLGKTYKQVMTKSEFMKISDNSILLSSIVCENTDFETIESKLGNDSTILENIRYQGNHLFATCDAVDSSFMVISIPFDKGWSITVNGIDTELFNINGGLIGIEIPKGHNEIEMYFTPEGFRTGAISTAIGSVLFFVIIIFEKFKSKKEKS